MPPSSEDPTSAAPESVPLAPAAAESDTQTAEIPGGSPKADAPGDPRESLPPREPHTEPSPVAEDPPRTEDPRRRRRRRRRKPASADATPAAAPAGPGETAAVAETASPAVPDDGTPTAIRPRRRRRRRHPPRPPNPQARLLAIAEAGLPDDAAAGDAAPGEGNAAVPAAAETASGRPHLTLRLRRPRAPRPFGSAVRTPAAEASAVPTPTEDAPTAPPRRPRRRRRKPAAAPQAGPSEAGETAPQTERGSHERGDGARGPRERDRDRLRGNRRRGAPDRPREGGRGRARAEPERKLYALEAVVDRGFEDVEEEGETRRIPWTILKRTVADQKSGRQMSAVYVLQRDGADQEFPNLGAARDAAHKTIIHPEKLTLSKAEHAAARGGGEGKKAR